MSESINLVLPPYVDSMNMPRLSLPCHAVPPGLQGLLQPTIAVGHLDANPGVREETHSVPCKLLLAEGHPQQVTDVHVLYRRRSSSVPAYIVSLNRYQSYGASALEHEQKYGQYCCRICSFPCRTPAMDLLFLVGIVLALCGRLSRHSCVSKSTNTACTTHPEATTLGLCQCLLTGQQQFASAFPAVFDLLDFALASLSQSTAAFASTGQLTAPLLYWCRACPGWSPQAATFIC